MAQDKGLTSQEKALIAARAADSKKATDIIIQDVRELMTGVTDYFVIVTARNNRQIDAVIDAIREAEVKEAGVKPFHIEGAQEGFWALLDFGDIVVHVFQPEGRDYYRLEQVWNDAPRVEFVPEARDAEENAGPVSPSDYVEAFSQAPAARPLDR